MKVGVLALQGDVREHIDSLLSCEEEAVPVRRASEIESIDALVLPGGESTTIAQLAEVFGIFDLIKNKIKNGMPVYGSCAGMILLADQILDAKQGQKSFGGLDITVRRNAFGGQPKILCEGGPTLITALIEMDLLDQLFLSRSTLAGDSDFFESATTKKMLLASSSDVLDHYQKQ